MAFFDVMFGGKREVVHVHNKEFNGASQEDVVRHVLGRHSEGTPAKVYGKKDYMTHGNIKFTDQAGDGGIHAGTHTYEGQRRHFRIIDRGP